MTDFTHTFAPHLPHFERTSSLAHMPTNCLTSDVQNSLEVLRGQTPLWQPSSAS